MTVEVRAELVANILDVPVRIGQHVGPDDLVVLLESMKMEIPVLAEASGVIGSVDVSPGDVVRAGDLLVTITQGE